MVSYKNIRTSVSLDKELNEIVERYSKIEGRSKSNMICNMIKAYDTIHKSKY